MALPWCHFLKTCALERCDKGEEGRSAEEYSYHTSLVPILNNSQLRKPHLSSKYASSGTQHRTTCLVETRLLELMTYPCSGLGNKKQTHTHQSERPESKHHGYYVEWVLKQSEGKCVMNRRDGVEGGVLYPRTKIFQHVNVCAGIFTLLRGEEDLNNT
jgi:hypothetical protein